MKLFLKSLLLCLGLLCPSIRCQINNLVEDADLGLDPFDANNTQVMQLPQLSLCFLYSKPPVTATMPATRRVNMGHVQE